MYAWQMLKSTISSKGQITVPADVRDQLGLTPGTVVLFEPTPGGVLLKKGFIGEHPVDRFVGALQLRRPVDALLNEMRGPRPRPAKARKR